MVYSEVVNNNIRLQCMGENVSEKAKYLLDISWQRGVVKLIFFLHIADKLI